MNIEKIREEFEAWQAKETPGADLAHCGALIGEGPARESYRNMYVAERWIGWQASRAAIEVELPVSTEFSASDSPGYVLERCSGMLTHQGLKVKSC